MNAPSPPSVEFFKKLPVDERGRWGSTNIKGSLKEHEESKARLAKEAEARRNVNGNAEVNVNTEANGSTEAAVVFKYSWNLCDYLTNNKSNFVSHSETKAHLANEAKARRNSDIDAGIDAESAIAYYHNCK
ncbi:hypothetical protein V8C34DRAFT_323059 [Trichoderma compactum]